MDDPNVGVVRTMVDLPEQQEEKKLDAENKKIDEAPYAPKYPPLLGNPFSPNSDPPTRSPLPPPKLQRKLDQSDKDNVGKKYTKMAPCFLGGAWEPGQFMVTYDEAGQPIFTYVEPPEGTDMSLHCKCTPRPPSFTRTLNGSAVNEQLPSEPLPSGDHS